MTPTVSPAKLTARPAVLPAKMRDTGFNSRPPFCKLFRVATKSAVLRAAVVAKRKLFLRSQNLWLGASGRVIGSAGLTKGEASIALGCSNAREACCASAGAPRHKKKNKRAAFGLRIEPIHVGINVSECPIWPLVLVLTYRTHFENGPSVPESTPIGLGLDYSSHFRRSANRGHLDLSSVQGGNHDWDFRRESRFHVGICSCAREDRPLCRLRPSPIFKKINLGPQFQGNLVILSTMKDSGLEAPGGFRPETASAAAT
jgi:hypothetical protein